MALAVFSAMSTIVGLLEPDVPDAGWSSIRNSGPASEMVPSSWSCQRRGAGMNQPSPSENFSRSSEKECLKDSTPWRAPKAFSARASSCILVDMQRLDTGLHVVADKCGSASKEPTNVRASMWRMCVMGNPERARSGNWIILRGWEQFRYGAEG